MLQSSTLECDFSRWKVPLAICQPPYFNVYKYSGILSLEMAWLGYDIRAIRQQEIREFFKVGKPENVLRYVTDLTAALRDLARRCARSAGLDGGRRRSRMGSGSALRGWCWRRSAIYWLPSRLRCARRGSPRPTWAASRRQTGQRVGVAVADFVVLLRAVDGLPE